MRLPSLPSLERRRKFTLAMTALLASFVLALTGVVDGANWVAAVGLIVGLYGGAEAFEGWGRRNGSPGPEGGG